MGRIVVFGAGGRAGRRTVREAVSRGHQVTAVVPDPEREAVPGGDGVTVTAGDVIDPDSVARVAAGHDLAISAVYRQDVTAVEFYTAVADGLVRGLAKAGVTRLLAVGIGTSLEVAPGVRVHDTPDFPAEYRLFSLGHVAQLEGLKGSGAELDWVVVTPPPTLLDDDAPRTGVFRVGSAPTVLPPGGNSTLFAYADLAVALLDEAESGAHHRQQIAVGY